MLYPVFGLPGPLTDWCCEAVAEVLREQGRLPQVFVLSTVEDLAVRLIEGHGSLILLSHRPEQSLLSALRRAEVPIIVAAESPLRSADVRTADEGLDRLESVREVLADLAALQDMPRHQTVLVVSRQGVLDDPTGTLAAIARHLGCPDVGCGSAGRVSLERLDALTPLALSRTAGTPVAGAVPGMARLRDPVGDALLGLEDAIAGNGLGRILIGPEFFIVTETGQVASETHLDATGRARGLVHGPFICLARGDWIARCVHRYSEDLASASFVIDVVSFGTGSVQELARSSFKIPSSGGLVETTLQFRVETPRIPLEVRLFAERAIFSGEISLGPVIFSRTDSSRAEAYPLSRM